MTRLLSTKVKMVRLNLMYAGTRNSVANTETDS